MSDTWDYDPNSWWDSDGPHTYVPRKEGLWTKIKRGVSHWWWRCIELPLSRIWWNTQDLLENIVFPFQVVFVVLLGVAMGIIYGIMWKLQKKDPKIEAEKLRARLIK